MKGRGPNGVRLYVVSAFSTAVLCILGPLTFPIGPVPVSLATFWICLTAGLLGAKRGALCVLVYLLLGAAGLPVFSSFTGGGAVLLGPTGGYLVGYILLAFCTGVGTDYGPGFRLIGMLMGTVLLYVLGAWWFCIQTGLDFWQSAVVCVIPFLPFDAIKITAALLLLPRISRSLKKTGYV